jgi:acyl-CoA synthetase (AMP-forming)/AMP-acid ligase II
MLSDRLSAELENRNTVGVVSTNSIDFIKKVFTSYKEDEVVVLLKNAQDEYKIKMTNVEKIVIPERNYGWFTEKVDFKSTDSIAQISFSSGTTGNPKGVLLSHRALNDVVERLVDIMDIDSSISEYVGIPVNYSFGFGRCRVVASVGGRFFVPEGGFNPFEIKEMLEKDEINAISAVPSLWRVLFDNEDIFGKETQKVKWIEIGSQYMSSEEKLRLSRIFPQATIVQHYGLTEASRSTFLRLNDTPVEFYESVGKGYGKTKIKLSDDGRIMIMGPHVSKKIIKDAEVVDNVSDDDWHLTNDLGDIKEGFVYYKGRSDDIINCGGIKVYPDIIEKRIRELMGVEKGIAVARGNDKVRGEIILICYLKELEPQKEAIVKAAQTAAGENEIKGSGSVKLMPLDSFPATDTGKIKRRLLTELYSEYTKNIAVSDNKSERDDQTENLSDTEEKIIKAWKEVLKVSTIKSADTFYDLGGDSLTAISVIVKMNRMGLPKDLLQGMLQGMSVRELSEKIDQTDPTVESHRHTIRNQAIKSSLNVNALRGVFVFLVIGAHWSGFILDRLPGAITEVLSPFLSFFFNMGTPGFAIVYGLTVGFSLFDISLKDTKRFKSILRNTQLLLGGGIIVLSLLSVIELLLLRVNLTSTIIASSFYSVLMFYFLSSLTLSFWFRFFRRYKEVTVPILLTACILYISYPLIWDKLTYLRTTGFLELVKLAFCAKYSYFNLISGTFLGLTLGIHLKRNSEGERHFITWGAISILVGLIIAYHANRFSLLFAWPQPATFLWGWFVYWGVVMIFYKALGGLLGIYNRAGSFLRGILQFLSLTGLLAFPLYVGHELVAPLMSILEAIGITGTVALLIPMSMFLVVFYFLYRKMYEMNFQWKK